MKVLLLIFGMVVLCGSSATSQTMSLAVLEDGEYSRSFEVVTGEPFTVVTLLDTAGHEAAAAEWVQTELLITSPGVFKLAAGSGSCRQRLELDLPPDNGEYVCAFGACVPSSEQLEVLQVSYADFFGGSVADDLVLTIRGLQPGDSVESTFDGSPGFIDCNDTGFSAIMGGGDAWETGSGVIVPSGALVLNPTPPLVVGASGQPMSLLKARYR